jgi:hypothetical protein
MKIKFSKLEKFSCVIELASIFVYWNDYIFLAVVFVFSAIGLLLLDMHLFLKSLEK